eukprot:TRINITY_DN68487_c0_g1_i1.p1 TRINITY_DN68487_c0_g1~~TRINITY_DN68487_c0_g1_i1.p1  ORF type:complete len:628 (-),score=71.35 TRINITY_DN68487_c0_g1_i1:241-1914(-)
MVPEKGTRVARSLEVWDTICVFTVILAGYSVPFGLALPRAAVQTLRVINAFLDIIFTADIIVHFLVAYPKPTADPTKLLWETSAFRIAIRYCGVPFTHNGKGGWFWLDAASVLPGWVNLFWNPNAESLLQDRIMNFSRFIRFFRLFRMMRLVRVIKIIDDKRVVFGFPHYFTNIVKYVFIATMVAHFQACVLIAIESVVTHDSSQFSVTRETSWLAVMIAAKGNPCDNNDCHNDPFTTYTLALYGSIMTLVGIGYGDITPANNFERNIFTFFMLLTAFVWTYVTANVVTALSHTDPHNQLFKQRQDELNSMLSQDAVPRDLQMQLRRFMVESKHTAMLRSQVQVVKTNMSSGLQAKLARHNPAMRVFRENVFWASDLPEGALAAIVTALQPFFYSPLEFISMVGRMILVREGIVGCGGRFLSRGGVLGCDTMLLETTSPDSCPLTRTLSFVDLLCLDKLSLREVCRNCPLTDMRIRRAQIRTAVWRAFCSTAKAIKAGKVTKKESHVSFGNFARETQDDSAYIASSVGRVLRELLPMEEKTPRDSIRMNCTVRHTVF